jgi:hypothetical protein
MALGEFISVTEASPGNGGADDLLLHKRLNLKSAIYAISNSATRYLESCTGHQTHKEVVAGANLGTEAAAKLLRRFCGARIVALSATSAEGADVPALRLGTGK